MSSWIRFVCLLITVFATAPPADGQNIGLYNTDSLINVLSKTEQTKDVIQRADEIYRHTSLDTANISFDAFRVAYLEKYLIDKRMVHIRHRHRYRNRRLLTIVDFTKKGNARRFAVVDIKSERLLFDTLVSQGSGKGEKRNNKFEVPKFFSNTINSELSSLGMLGTRKARQTENPCHLCKYAATRKHKDVIILEGLEKGINDNARKRDIVIHTTGSADLRSAKGLPTDDSNYKVVPSECKCYHTNDEGMLSRIACYASTCGLAENNGYIGQSNGCLVLPEEDHIEIMQVIRKKSLIFIYSNAISGNYSYFECSPVIKALLRHKKY